jgi:ABC-type transport system involved in cytochrome c biogenesis permease subunit
VDTQATDLLLHAGRAEPADLARASNVPSLRGALASLGDQPEFRLPLERLSERYFAFLAADPDLPGGPETWRLLPKGAGRQLLDELQAAWRARDVHAVNALPARIDELCRSAGGGAPSAAVRRMELIYNRMRQFTVVFAGFALALVLMIVAAASSSRTVRRAGLAVFALSTAALAAGFVARWVLSGRAWYLPPVMNQFEAVVGSALLASVVAILLEWAYGRNYFALAAAFYATAALLGGLIFPEAMAAGMSAAHGILDSPVMGLHVAVIVVGHAMAGMTLVISAAYLAAACRRALAGRPLDSSGADLSDPADGRDALATIDRCNLIVAQLAAWSIVAGTMLGAYWGDFAWGRWWGWDPKETWALMTALVYLAVLHLRLVTPPSRRGLLTAVGCIVGCAVMLFNWTVVNYLIVGKHSYA